MTGEEKEKELPKPKAEAAKPAKEKNESVELSEDELKDVAGGLINIRIGGN